MTIEATLERIAVALERQAAALEAPMAAIQAARAAAPAPAAAAPAEAPAKRGPGRPPKTEAQVTPAPVAAPAPAPAAVDLSDPDLLGGADADAGNFLDDEPAPAVEILPTADDVRKALIKYGQRPGCSQEKARALLKQHGHVDTLKALKPEFFKAVIDAAGV
jgi:hypothetical protein